jgi:hypothetical protein
MRPVVPFVASLCIGLFCFGPSPAVATASSSGFSFNWTAQPGSPQPWVPGAVNDWDLIANIDGPTDVNGAMEAGHGADCSPPPASHHVVTLADSVFLCKGHMMTAIYGGGDAFADYGAIYFTPAQLVDWSQGPATVSWRVSTERTSTRDWWDVNMTPFAQNLMFPLDKDLPAYQGEPESGLQIKTDNGNCGTILRVQTISNSELDEVSNDHPCVESQFPPSARTRSQFQIQISANRLKVYMPEGNTVFYDGPINLPFNKAVLQFSHHSYNPLKGENLETGAPAPNTFHWSDVAISPATPFIMLRPQQPPSLHEGRDPVLSLPQVAPQHAFLRFAGIGNFQVSFDGGQSFQPVRLQGAKYAPEHFASYWTPVPAGTTQVAIRGRDDNSSNLPWWVEDVSVWASDVPSSVNAPPPTQQPPAAIVPEATPAAQGGSSATRAAPAPAALASRPPTSGGPLTALAHRVAGLGWTAVILAVGLGGLVVAAAGVMLWRRRRSLKPDSTTTT